MNEHAQINPAPVFEWLIVGGGVHGCFMANMLLRNRIADKKQIRIIDPNSDPLANWKRNAANIGMKYLRSPLVHHLEIEAFSLKHFAQNVESSKPLFISPNDRPALSLFNDHSDSLLSRTGFSDIYIQGLVSDIQKTEHGYSVSTDSGIIRSRNVILAMGQSNRAEWPSWAAEAKSERVRISHVFDPDYSPESIPEKGTVVVIGGGMSGVQTALSLKNGERNIILLTAYPLRQANFDSDPGWMGPKYLNGYQRVGCYVKRRRIISKARNKGTITHELQAALNAAVKRKQITIVHDTVVSCTKMLEDLVLLNLKNADSLGANCIVLATGFGESLPGGRLTHELASRYGLEKAPCGFPITDEFLQWDDGLFVTGALAELEIGPVSRNISGARLAAERIYQYCKMDVKSDSKTTVNSFTKTEKKSA